MFARATTVRWYKRLVASWAPKRVICITRSLSIFPVDRVEPMLYYMDRLSDRRSSFPLRLVGFIDLRHMSLMGASCRDQMHVVVLRELLGDNQGMIVRHLTRDLHHGCWDLIFKGSYGGHAKPVGCLPQWWYYLVGYKGVDSEEFGQFGGLVYLSYEKITVPCGRLHQISLDVLDYTDMTLRDWNGSGYHHGLQDRDHDHVVIDFGSHAQSQGTRTSPSVTQVDSPQAIASVAQEADSPQEIEDLGLFGFRKSLDSYPALRDKLLIDLDIVSPLHGIRQFGELLSLTYGVKEKAIVPGGRVHQITLDVLDYARIHYLHSLNPMTYEEGFPLNSIAMITDLLDSTLQLCFGFVPPVALKIRIVELEGKTVKLQIVSVFLGLNQYFVASDVGHGKMRWYAFHGEPPSSDPFPKGDAAHPMQPNLGQGGCMAIECLGIRPGVMDGAISISAVQAREYLVATADGFGIVVETIYVILFLIYAPKGIRGRTVILVVILDVAISTVAVVTTQLALQREARGGVVGVMGAGLNIVMYFSPLSCHVTDPKALRLGFDVNLIAIALQEIFGVSLRIIVHIWVMSKKGPLYVAMFNPIGIIFAIIMGIGFLCGSINL
ncbi:hypothetical protein JHK87_015749 [Glycine soja]|nr:hypothetical protein JHK87_015749 [Glycine soja]